MKRHPIGLRPFLYRWLSSNILSVWLRGLLSYPAVTLSIDFLLSPLRFDFGVVAIVARVCWRFHASSSLCRAVKDRHRVPPTFRGTLVSLFTLYQLHPPPQLYCRLTTKSSGPSAPNDDDPVVLGPD